MKKIKGKVMKEGEEEEKKKEKKASKKEILQNFMTKTSVGKEKGKKN